MDHFYNIYPNVNPSVAHKTRLMHLKLFFDVNIHLLSDWIFCFGHELKARFFPFAILYNTGKLKAENGKKHFKSKLVQFGCKENSQANLSSM